MTLTQFGKTAGIEKVTDMIEIQKYGVLRIPAFVVDEK